MQLKDLYRTAQRPLVTAHRGFSGRYPENTIPAFEQAVGLGVDIVEFDVRDTSDGVLVVIHDALLDRTTDGSGSVHERPWSEVRGLNAAHWSGPHDRGERVRRPLCETGIPAFADVLALLAGKVALNIQVYTRRPEALEKIVSLYRRHKLQDSAFLMLSSFADGEKVRAIAPEVAICIGEDRSNLERHLQFGVDFVQPAKNCLTDSYVRRLLQSAIPANVFYANDAQEMTALIRRGLPGIMTDFPDLLINLIAGRRAESALRNTN